MYVESAVTIPSVASSLPRRHQGIIKRTVAQKRLPIGILFVHKLVGLDAQMLLKFFTTTWRSVAVVPFQPEWANDEVGAYPVDAGQVELAVLASLDRAKHDPFAFERTL